MVSQDAEQGNGVRETENEGEKTIPNSKAIEEG